MNQNYKIECKFSEHGGYSIYVNDELIFECVSFAELQEINFHELLEFYGEALRFNEMLKEVRNDDGK